jgi:hypothetical protein
MGSGRTPTTSGCEGTPQKNTVPFGDLPPVSQGSGGIDKDQSLLIPLTGIDESVWKSLSLQAPVYVSLAGGTRLEVQVGAVFLGLVPHHFVETVLERHLFVGSVAVIGKAPPDLRVRLSPAG